MFIVKKILYCKSEYNNQTSYITINFCALMC
jgi:hypothetical protein